jgi:hypothetical protein
MKRMLDLKLVVKERVEKTNKYVLSLTKDGDDILKILMKVVKK